MVVLLAAVVLGPAAPRAQRPAAATPGELARAWDAHRVSPSLPSLLRHAEVESRLKQAQALAPDLFSIEEIGRSVEGRSISHLWFGSGAFHVLLWSQMHGDEPTATAALFDLIEYIRRGRAADPVRTVLGALTVHLVPMLNPDGAERFQRRNAQGIDINRDALLLQTPEGRLLKELRDRLNPRLGFNLHNQGWRTSVGKTGRPASISLLAVSFDEARTESEGRLVAKKACGLIRDAVETLAPGQVARYDEEFEVRAFGDNVTKWGTPVILIETGPHQGDRPDAELVRLNFVAIVSALDALATGRVHDADPMRYESLPMNDSGLFHTLIRSAMIVTGTGVAPFTGDVGIGVNRIVAKTPSEPGMRLVYRIEDLGDLRVFGALETIDATGLTVAPLVNRDAKPGDEIALPAGPVGADIAVVAVGSPGDLLLLKPTAGPNRYIVVRVLRSEQVIGGQQQDK